MISSPTVYILGAGASWHYGYPTGEQLVDRVRILAKRVQQHADHMHSESGDVPLPLYLQRSHPQGSGEPSVAWKKLSVECADLIDRIDVVRPIVIDHFLSWHGRLQDLGKLLIAGVILECEATWNFLGANQHRLAVPLHSHQTRVDEAKKAPDHWYRFIIHRISHQIACSRQIMENKVHFVTFNYDLSLETHLRNALLGMDHIKSSDVEEFLANDRVLHVYGKIRNDNAVGSDSGGATPDFIGSKFLDELGLLGKSLPHGDSFVQAASLKNQLLDQFFRASQGMRTIPETKDFEGEALQKAQQVISEADTIYILGYGFESTNNRRIGLDKIHKPRTGERSKRVMFTNYEDRNLINKQVGMLLVGSHNEFLNSFSWGKTLEGFYIEKSIRSTYDALAYDFFEF